jgi:DNA polymerase-3 subunit epsilon
MNSKPNHDFVAIDVEYADTAQNICQVGLAVVRNLQIVERRSWLIQPPGNFYEKRCMAVHGIMPNDTVWSPTFAEVWPEIAEYLKDDELWAHNATSTEEPVINKNLRFANIDDNVRVFDSRDLYQRPGCPANSGNKLVQCCMALGLPVENHHDALSDAEMCAQIVIAYIEGKQPVWDNVPLTLEEVRKAEQGKRVLRLGEFTDYFAQHPSGEEDVHAVLTSTYDGAPEQEVDVWDRGDPRPGINKGLVDFARLNMSKDNPIRDKVVVPTGEFLTNREEIKRALKAMGATYPTSISGKTYAVLFGTANVSRKKLLEIEKQEAKGHHIFRIVGDADLEELLYGDGRKFFK